MGGAAGAGGAGTPPATFALIVGEIDALDNEDCTECVCDSCPAFPPENTGLGDGADVSPPMSWSAGPDGTLSYALVLKDLSNGTSHWAIWDIPASVTELPAELPPNGETTGDLADAKQATGFGRTPVGYFGSGACDHVYEFKVYALGTATLENPGSSADDIRDAVEASADLLASSLLRVRSDSSEGCSPAIAPDCGNPSDACMP
jgi:Raf kinase inhibitor-like YbhB/YbcL family protein